MSWIAVVFLQLVGLVVHHQQAVEVVAGTRDFAQIFQPVFYSSRVPG